MVIAKEKEFAPVLIKLGYSLAACKNGLAWQSPFSKYSDFSKNHGRLFREDNNETFGLDKLMPIINHLENFMRVEIIGEPDKKSCRMPLLNISTSAKTKEEAIYKALIEYAALTPF